MHAHLETFADQSDGPPLPPKARRPTKTTEPRCDARPALSRLAGVDLTAIEGIEECTALGILAAIGTDRHRWPSVTHVCRWLGRCPQHKISGGKGLSRRVRPGAHRGAVALRRAARSVPRSQRACGAFCRRMKARLGTPKAITATAHQLARLVSHLRKHGSPYVQQGLEHYAAPYHARQVTTMAKQAQALGDTLVLLVAQGEEPPPRLPRWHTLLHLVMPWEATSRQGAGRGASSERRACCHNPPLGLPRGSSTSKTTAHLPPEPPSLMGEFLGRRFPHSELRVSGAVCRVDTM